MLAVVDWTQWHSQIGIDDAFERERLALLARNTQREAAVALTLICGA